VHLLTAIETASTVISSFNDRQNVLVLGKTAPRTLQIRLQREPSTSKSET
jgi:hypothetical protein